MVIYVCLSARFDSRTDLDEIWFGRYDTEDYAKVMELR